MKNNIPFHSDMERVSSFMQESNFIKLDLETTYQFHLYVSDVFDKVRDNPEGLPIVENALPKEVDNSIEDLESSKTIELSADNLSYYKNNKDLLDYLESSLDNFAEGEGTEFDNLKKEIGFEVTNKMLEHHKTQILLGHSDPDLVYSKLAAIQEKYVKVIEFSIDTNNSLYTLIDHLGGTSMACIGLLNLQGPHIEALNAAVDGIYNAIKHQSSELLLPNDLNSPVGFFSDWRFVYTRKAAIVLYKTIGAPFMHGEWIHFTYMSNTNIIEREHIVDYYKKFHNVVESVTTSSAFHIDLLTAVIHHSQQGFF